MNIARGFRASALASLIMLSAACAVSSSPDAAPEPTPAPVSEGKLIVKKTLQLNDDATITARRASVTRKTKGLLGDAPGAQGFIPLSTTFVVNPIETSALSLSMVRSAGSVKDVVVSVVSSDPSIATAAIVGGTMSVIPSGKLGNTYVTTYDAQGNATEKFMLLAATAKAGTLVLEDDATAPVMLVTRDGRVATDFQTSDPDAMGDLTDAGGVVFVQDLAALQQRMRAQIAATGSDVNAIYYPSRDILVRLSGAARQGAATLGTRGIGFNMTLVTQGDFEQYVDFGGSLSSSPLRDPGAVESKSIDTPRGRAQLSSDPTINTVILTDGRRLAPTDPVLTSNDAHVASYEVTYEPLVSAGPLGENEEDVGPLKCKASAAVKIDWSSIVAVETKLDASASWNHGSPSIEMKFEPHVRLGGEIKVGGAAKLDCEMELFKVPLAEWGVPLLGAVKVQVPVKLETTYGVSGKAGLITPRIEIGSAADVTKAGAVGFSYSASGGLKNISDLAMRSTETKLKLATGTDVTTPLKGENTAGIAAGLELEASVKTWLFKATVSASIADVLFGSRREGDFTFDQQGGYKVTVGKDNGVGLFTTLEPTLHIDFKFFKNSFRLFSVDVPPLFLLRDPESQTDEVLAADVQVVKTSLGDGMLYSDALIWNDNSGWSANIVVIRGKDEYRLTATNGTLNLAGIPLRSGDQLLTYWNEIDTQHCQHTRAGTNICPIIEKRSPLYTAP